MRKLATLTVLVLLIGDLGYAAEYRPLHDVPYVSGIEIDGDAADWAGRGFEVGVLIAPYGDTPAGDDANARFRLGWSEEGLAVLVFGTDDEGSEAAHPGMFWTGDAVEIFLSRGVGSAQRYHVLIGPGLDPAQGRLRTFVIDSIQGQTSPGDIAVEAAAITAATDYVMEVLLPWDHLGIRPERGTEVALQFNLYDRDADGWAGWSRMSWYPRPDAKHSFSAMHRLRLAEAAGDPVRVRASVAYQLPDQVDLQIFAAAELVGESFGVEADGAAIVDGVFAADGPRAAMQVAWPLPAPDHQYKEIRVLVDGKEAARLNPPDPAEQRARALMDVELVCTPAVFTLDTLPACSPEDPHQLVQLLGGTYTVRTSYYDAGHQRVETATTPGRYGAVIELVPDEGTPFRRYQTLFGIAESIDGKPVDADGVLAPGFGIDAAVAADHADLVERHIASGIMAGGPGQRRAAQALAWLHERPTLPEETDFTQDFWGVDRQWWVEMKRRLNGMAERYPGPFVCPRPIAGAPARVLREGSLAEAGMAPGTDARIDSVCRAWSADTDEAFGVLVARHGVIVLHAAYGERDGRPMTVNDRSHMASVTKLAGGTLFMMLVDQGVIGLDDPIDPLVPAFAGIERDRPLTPRLIYTMTHGLWGHGGDFDHDYEARLAQYYPHLAVGRFQRYSGRGLALGGKIIEAVSGEALPRFYKNHLFGPLGCDNTVATRTGGGMETTPLDMGKICQMLLNGGAYGDKRFMSAESARAMYPTPLTWTEEDESGNRWGIGTNKFDEHGLGPSTYGHDGATVATARIDPENDLVIVVTRNSTGLNFAKYQPQFIAAVVAGLQ